ncbi:MAG: hypothetical protein AAF824_23155 [Bacteroidota bacterium]
MFLYRCLTICLFAACSTSLCLSQVKFIPGKIITFSQDTLVGELDYLNKSGNPTFVTFKNSQTGELTTYKPHEVKAFLVEEGKFVGGIIEIEKSPYRDMDFNYDANFQVVQDTFFLSTLIEGSKSLYSLNLPNGKQLFYIFRNGAYELLYQKKYLISMPGGAGNTREIIRENKKYIGQLTTYFQDCKNAYFKRKINELTYNRTSLRKIFESYYNFLSSTPTFKQENLPPAKQVKRSRYRTSILLGYVNSKIQFTSGEEFLKETDYPRQGGFLIGLGFDVPLKRYDNKWFINSELSILTYSHDGFVILPVSESIENHVTSDISITAIKVGSMMRRRITLGSEESLTTLFWNGGASFAATVGSSNTNMEEFYVFGNRNIIREGEFEGPVQFNLSLLAGAGISLNKFMFELRAEFGRGSSRLANSSLQRISLIGTLRVGR